MVVSIHKHTKRSYYEVIFDIGRFRHEARELIVAGTFNNWQTSYRRLRSGFINIHSKSSTIKVLLPSGQYEYKYYDVTHNQWMEVEAFPEIYRGYHWDYLTNPFGTRNCVLSIP